MAKLSADHTLLSRKLLRLVVVLYNLQKGLAPEEVAEQLKMEKHSAKTDEICKESRLGDTSKYLNSIGSFEESSQLSCGFVFGGGH
jgi:hypothetical protein